MKLSTLSILLGLAVALPGVYGLMNPKQFAETLRRFPRNVPLGWLFVGLATAWFLYNLRQESIADFEHLKKPMMLGFAALGVGTCVYVKDFLAARGAALLMLLLAKFMVDTARWHESDWRLVIVVWAYALVLAGMWFTISPWRLRDVMEWKTANEKRIKAGCAFRLAFGGLLVGLGVAVF
jgi:predicted DNA-binding transcriptional regulator AlpA